MPVYVKDLRASDLENLSPWGWAYGKAAYCALAYGRSAYGASVKRALAYGP